VPLHCASFCFRNRSRNSSRDAVPVPTYGTGRVPYDVAQRDHGIDGRFTPDLKVADETYVASFAQTTSIARCGSTGPMRSGRETVDVGPNPRPGRVFLHRVGTLTRERGRIPVPKSRRAGASSGSRTAIPAEAGDYVRPMRPLTFRQ